jgi:RND family efflux transporter MFP subunit
MLEPPEILRYRPPRHLKTIGLAALCVAAGVVAFGVVGRVDANQNLKAWTDAQAIPTVKLITLSAETQPGALVLPGDVRAFYDAPIHARVSGYLKRWYTDIGTPVRAGQLLAEIDTPDLDQQLLQAEADLATAVANQHLAEITARRWAGLLAQDAVSRQDADDKNGDLASKTALVAAARANVERLQAFESFKRITAPFDGVVTSRSTDIGALISVGGPSDTPLFTVTDERRLRIYVRVPQSDTAVVTPGLTATLTVPEHPGRVFAATLAASADAIAPQSGTLLVQLQLDNGAGLLKPGDYAQVRFSLPPDKGTIKTPSSALIFGDTGMSVAVVGSDGRVVIKPVTIARDLGSMVEVSAGLTPADRVIDNPPDSLRPGDTVKIAEATGGLHGAP